VFSHFWRQCRWFVEEQSPFGAEVENRLTGHYANQFSSAVISHPGGVEFLSEDTGARKNPVLVLACGRGTQRHEPVYSKCPHPDLAVRGVRDDQGQLHAVRITFRRRKPGI